MAAAKAMRKVEKIRQIVRLKQIMIRWKLASLRLGGPALSYIDDTDNTAFARRTPSGFLAVYVGPERRRFVIPARFVNLPVFVGLLEKTAEEFGFETTGGLVLPCEVSFFKDVLKFLEKDERRFGKLSLDGFLKMVTDAGFDSCKAARAAGSSFTPLLQEARV
ncbi:protein SMALL AUXIN UP-REGULATED RNA 51-like [Argentina anserina]|uniref:protein SMALL AUXIN UP-REGULATED RNA 51-like n=1 Tax=Argentina anserina TaxID=57926 RepID=UPI0021767C5C|nr:protein SMALL AUXIN UP-REGULATED RNA 51-like [Potentilla anserina]